MSLSGKSSTCLQKLVVFSAKSDGRRTSTVNACRLGVNGLRQGLFTEEIMEMNTPLDPQQLTNARRAILDRFVQLKTAPNAMANIHLFTEIRVNCQNGYWHAAIAQLATDECIKDAKAGLYLRLMPKGYNEAHGLA